MLPVVVACSSRGIKLPNTNLHFAQQKHRLSIFFQMIRTLPLKFMKYNSKQALVEKFQVSEFVVEKVSPCCQENCCLTLIHHKIFRLGIFRIEG